LLIPLIGARQQQVAVMMGIAHDAFLRSILIIRRMSFGNQDN
jgi:hypothetical protein